MTETSLIRIVLSLQVLRILSQFKLFFSTERLIPPMGILGPSSPELNLWLSVGLIGALLITIIYPERKSLYIGLAIFPLALLLDTTKLSTVNYQSALIIAWIMVTRFSTVTALYLKWGLSFIYVVPYFWSGISKINHLYFLDDLQFFLEIPMKLFMIPVNHWIIYPIGTLSILLEISLPFLFFKQNRWFPALVTFLHLYILMALGPLGGNILAYIWAWNFECLIVMLLLWRGPLNWPEMKITRLFLLWALIPAFSFGGLVSDPYAFKMMSGANNFILYRFQGTDDLPPFEKFTIQRRDFVRLFHQKVFLSETGAFFPESEYNIRNMCNYLSSLYPGRELNVALMTQKSLFDRERVDYQMPCRETQNYFFLIREFRKRDLTQKHKP